MRVAIRLSVASMAFVFAGSAFAASDWRVVDYSALVDGRQLSHSGEPVAALLKKLDGRPLPPPGQRPADLTAHILLDPLLEHYAFVISDALDALSAPTDPPLVEIGGLWPSGAPQPAWAELLRSRSLILESDGRGKLRAILPADPAAAGATDSEAAAHAAWDKAWPVVRLALAAERRRLAALGKNLPEDHSLDVTAYAFRRFPERTRFELGTRPYHVAVTDTRPTGQRAPLDLAGWQRLLERGQSLEGARLTVDGGVLLFGGEAPSKPTLLGRPLTLADFAVAYRAVFHGGVGEPYMSLDRGLSPYASLVNYGGRLRDTALGLVSLLCDVRFKTFSQGIDPVSGGDVRDAVRQQIPGFRAHVERFAADARSASASGQQTRFWFYPDAVEIVLSNQGDLMALARARMSAASERVEAATMQPIKGEDAPWTKDTVTEINQDYDALAKFFPELADLDEVVRLLSLFTWLRQAEADGLPVPELDALLAVDLPALATPRRYPQLLAFNALPPAGGPAPVVVLDRAPLAAALEALAAPEDRFLSAARRFRRALAALDPSVSDQAALAKDLAPVQPENTEETILDVLAYKAERLRMHHLALTSLTAAEMAPLQKRNQAGEALRVFSLGIGGLDLGMGSSLARASRRGGRLNFANALAGLLVANAGAPAGVPAPATAPPAGPREQWRTDPPQIGVAPMPDHGAAAGAVTIEKSSRVGGGRSVRLVYGADDPEARSRATFLDAGGRVQEFDRLEEGRLLRYSLAARGDDLVARPTPTAPDPPPTGPPAPGAGLLLVQPMPGGDDAPAVRLRFRRAGAESLEQTIPRQELQLLILGRDAGPSRENPEKSVAGFTAALGADRRVMFVAGRDEVRPPWVSSTAPLPGEEDAVTLARAFNSWWAAAGGGARRTSVVAADPGPAPGRWAKCPAPGSGALLLAPEDAFPGSSAALRTDLTRGWQGGAVAAAVPVKVSSTVVVLASAEPPGLLGARLRGLARNPALKGKLLAVISFGAPIRRDLPASLLAEGMLAGLGLADAPPAGQPRWVRDVLAFAAALAAPAGDRRIEDVPGPFLWCF